jgi:hypothetical protein
MTTSVKIRNTSTGKINEHTIEVIGGDGSKQVAMPGQEVTVNVWKGTEIKITEMDVGQLPPGWEVTWIGQI